MNLVRIAVLAAALALSAASTLSPNPIPEPDSCDTPAAAGVATVEIGARDEEAFRPLGDDEIAALQVGTQGVDMLPVRFRLAGSDAGCVTQRTTLYSCPAAEAETCGPDTGTQVGQSELPIKTYAEGTGRTTEPLFVLFDTVVESGSVLLVRSELGGAVGQVRLWIDQRP